MRRVACHARVFQSMAVCISIYRDPRIGLTSNLKGLTVGSPAVVRKGRDLSPYADLQRVKAIDELYVLVKPILRKRVVFGHSSSATRLSCYFYG